MDPALKEYLDKMDHDAKSDSANILKQLQTQTAHIDDLLRWKPDLKDRFSKVESMVTKLQAGTQPSSSGVVSLITSPPLLAVRGTLHRPGGHGEVDLNGGSYR
ncbi:hypothetical protein D1007_50513 [Hordeum vulgare]|nr:hypothetical protein D1007_50513 [Hordeum vulgare]